MQTDYKAWFEKYRPRELLDIVFPNDEIKNVIENFYNSGFIKGNILSYGPAGTGKTTLSEVLIHRIVKDKNDIFILGRKTEDVENLGRWLQQRPVGSNQKVVKIEEMDRLSSKAQVVLKDGLMEKYQHNTTFLATTNNPEKIDPALITRFNTRINFKELPPDEVLIRLKRILDIEKVSYNEDELKSFVEEHVKRGLRDLLNNAELASDSGNFQPNILNSFVGSNGSEDTIIEYIIYLTKYAENISPDILLGIIDNPTSDQNFNQFYTYTLQIFKNELRLNWEYIYNGLSNSDLDFGAKNIINNYWQDLELKRFKTTHTVSLIHELLLNIKERKGL